MNSEPCLLLKLIIPKLCITMFMSECRDSVVKLAISLFPKWLIIYIYIVYIVCVYQKRKIRCTRTDFFHLDDITTSYSVNSILIYIYNFHSKLDRGFIWICGALY
jgi:hypothetical protein